MANRFDFDGSSREHDAWLAQVNEAPLQPALPIIDAHHHLWVRGDAPYLLRELAADMNCGHRLVGTVFAECHAMYRRTGDEALRCVGEMEFVAGIAAMSAAGAFGTSGVCAAVVGAADLSLGAAVEPVLEALMLASGGRLRGIRASVCWDPSTALHRAAPRPGFLGEAGVRAGIAVLARQGLSLDCWLYHPQLPELTAVADAHPDLTIILNHAGTPILGGPYREQQPQVRKDWLRAMRDLAQRPNVYVKLGALPARFPRSRQAARPPDSAEVAAAWGPWIEPAIEAFGADRCMFESNFPVHKNWMSYPVTWNAFKHIAAGAGDGEQRDLFAGTAARVYRVGAVEVAG